MAKKKSIFLRALVLYFAKYLFPSKVAKVAPQAKVAPLYGICVLRRGANSLANSNVITSLKKNRQSIL